MDRSKLLDAEEHASTTDGDLHATLPPSPSYINEGFKAEDDDSLSSHESGHELKERVKDEDKPDEAAGGEGVHEKRNIEGEESAKAEEAESSNKVVVGGVVATGLFVATAPHYSRH